MHSWGTSTILRRSSIIVSFLGILYTQKGGIAHDRTANRIKTHNMKPKNDEKKLNKIFPRNGLCVLSWYLFGLYSTTLGIFTSFSLLYWSPQKIPICTHLDWRKIKTLPVSFVKPEDYEFLRAHPEHPLQNSHAPTFRNSKWFQRDHRRQVYIHAPRPTYFTIEKVAPSDPRN